MNWIVFGEDKSKWIPQGWQKDAEVRASNEDEPSDEKFSNLDLRDDIFSQEIEN